MSKRYWGYAAIHVVILGLLAVLLVTVFPPVARLMQSMVGELTMPEHVASHQERLNWEMWIERGYGEGVNTVGSLIFSLVGMVVPGLAIVFLVVPKALKGDPELDPTQMTIPIALRSTVLITALVVMLMIGSSLVLDSQWTGYFLASGFTMVGFLVLPYLTMALLSLYLGVYLWKRRNWKDEFPGGDELSDFYNKLKTR